MQKKSQTQWWFDPPLHAIYRHAPEEPHFVIAAASKKDNEYAEHLIKSILYIHKFINFKSSNQIKLGRAITYSIRTNFKLLRYVIFTVFEGDLLSAKFSSLKLIDSSHATKQTTTGMITVCSTDRLMLVQAFRWFTDSTQNYWQTIWNEGKQNRSHAPSSLIHATRRCLWTACQECYC